MPSSATATVTLPTDEQILIVREFDAPRPLVWKAWTTPALVLRWWAGRRGTMRIADLDLRVGGAYRFVMDARGGHEVAFHGEFREIVPEERIVQTEVFEGAPPGLAPAIDTITFRAEGERTVVELLMEVESREVRDMIIGSGMEGGMQEQMDLLEEIAIELGS